MHLALTGLHAIDREQAQRLFVADWAMSRGVSSQQLLKFAGLLRKDDSDDDDDDSEDDNDDESGDASDDSGDSDFDDKHLRWPAGTAGGIAGEFAPKDSGVAIAALYDALVDAALIIPAYLSAQDFPRASLFSLPFHLKPITSKGDTMVKLLAKPYQQFQTRTGTQYAADAYGVLANVAIGTDIADLMESGALPLPANPQSVDNLTATTDPTVSNDNTQDYGPGSMWLNTSSNRIWVCESAATGAAVWALSGVVPGVGIEPSSMLTYFGGGTQSFADAGVIYRYQAITGAGNGNDTTEDLLTSFSLPAGSLDVAGRTLQITASGSLANNAHSKTAKLYFGSSIVATTAAQTGANVGWQLVLQVQKVASNSQLGFYSPIVGTTHGGISLPLSGTEIDANAITIKVTGQTGTASANDVVLNSLVIEALN